MSIVGLDGVPTVDFTYQYDLQDADGRYNERQLYVDGALDSAEYTYFDDLGRVVSRRQLGSSNVRVDFAYTDLDQFDTLTRYASLTTASPVSVTDYVYDELHRLTLIDHGDVEYGYRYDRFNRIERFTNADGVSVYQHDTFNQLRAADQPGAASDEGC